MSWQATAWAVKQTAGSPSAKLLLLTLANYADADGCCWPSQEVLAVDTEQSVDTVQRRLKKLIDAGLTRKVPRAQGAGRWDSRRPTSSTCLLQKCPSRHLRHGRMMHLIGRSVTKA